MSYLRLFIASVFLLQGTICPSLCRSGLLADAAAGSVTQSQPPCHDMLDQSSSSDSAESVVIAGNSRLLPEDLENIDRLKEKQKNQAQKINSPKKPAQENPVEEKKAKPPCCDDDEMLITHTSVRVDGLMAEPIDLYIELPAVVMQPVFSTGSTLPARMQTPDRASPDLRILYSSFLI